MRRRDTMAAIWARALIYLGIIVGGWLGVLPALLLTLENKCPRVRLRGPGWVMLGALCGGAAKVLGLVSGYHLISRGHGVHHCRSIRHASW